MDKKEIKLENIKASKFTVNFPLPNGHIIPYVWKEARSGRPSIVSVPEEVFEYILYETKTINRGYLRLVEEEASDEIKEEVKSQEIDENIFTREEIIEALSKVSILKKTITKETPREIIMEFVNMANEIKTDSDSVKTYLAELLDCKDNKEFLFPVQPTE